MAESKKKTGPAKAESKEPAIQPVTTIAPADPSPSGKASFSESESPRPKKAGYTLALKFDENGVIQDGTRDDTKKRAKELLSDPRNVEVLGLKGTGIETTPILVDAGTVEFLYGIIGKVSGFAASKMLHAPIEVTAQVFTYSPQFLNGDPKTNRPGAVPITQKVLSKHGPDWMIQYADETALLGLLAVDFMQKMEVMKQWMQRQIDAASQPSPEAQPTQVTQ